MDFKPYPLVLEPSLHEKVWGGRQLQTRLGKILPTNQPYGESWEVYWKNRIANGEYRGKTLGDLIAEYPQEMVGSKNADPEFPLLIKFIDAQDWLSVQVHPDDKLAAELEGQPRGKTECWYVVDAVPGAQLVYGFSEKIDADGFRRALESGHGRDVLQYVNVAPGDFVNVPAGTMHAVGPGILIYELQQTSDTTYRVYDWDRPGLDGKPRELHLDKAMRATHFDVKPTAKLVYSAQPQPDAMPVKLLDGQYFSLSVWITQAGGQGKQVEIHNHASTPTLLTVIQGQVTLTANNTQVEPVTLRIGQSALIPPAIRDYFLAFGLEETRVLSAQPAAQRPV